MIDRQRGRTGIVGAFFLIGVGVGLAASPSPAPAQQAPEVRRRMPRRDRSSRS